LKEKFTRRTTVADACYVIEIFSTQGLGEKIVENVIFNYVAALRFSFYVLK